MVIDTISLILLLMIVFLCGHLIGYIFGNGLKNNHTELFQAYHIENERLRNEANNWKKNYHMLLSECEVEDIVVNAKGEIEGVYLKND